MPYVVYWKGKQANYYSDEELETEFTKEELEDMEGNGEILDDMEISEYAFQLMIEY